jgi:hypothetical protein
MQLHDFTAPSVDSRFTTHPSRRTVKEPVMTVPTRLFTLIAAFAIPILADPSLAGGPIHVNPQPLPPVHSDGRPQGLNARVNVNPQPLPPRWW